MSAKILAGAVGKVADRWLPNILGSPLLFWVGVFLIYVYSLEDDWDSFVGWFSNLPETSQLIAVGLAVSLAIASDFAIQQLEFPVLRFLEGYWFRWFFPRSRRWLIRRANRRQQQILDALKAIKVRELQGKSEADDFTKRLALEDRRARFPVKFEDDEINRYLMPTRLGNLLRAYERKPAEKYGLDAIVCWPRLWLLLPDPVKLDLSNARSDLNAAVRLWIWGVLFVVWGWLNWIAIPIGLGVAALAYYFWILPAAQVYGILIDATFDTHRHLLYDALGFPRPDNPATEAEVGQQLTQYLLGAFHPDSFQKPPPD